ncbi:SDR family oxidoreductase [Streptomyces sp. OE57]|uniref:SDR family oxidoreductase n=1 Tax=Streptomyces lacaronensis TaxID=3379885 RepID=UPI0039B72EB9
MIQLVTSRTDGALRGGSSCGKASRSRGADGAVVDPEEIGALAVFLISDDAKNINGVDLVIDGGATQTFQLLDRI